MISNIAKDLDILAISLSVLHNFDSLTKLLSDLYLAEFLDILKVFFPYIFIDIAYRSMLNFY